MCNITWFQQKKLKRRAPQKAIVPVTSVYKAFNVLPFIPCIIMSVPVASAISKSDSESVISVDMDSLVSSVKALDSADLFKLLKLAVTEAEKKAKAGGKAAKATKKAGSAPKGVIPSQLKKPRAWVDFTLKDAIENGWESFTVHQTKKDKDSGEKTEEEIEMPASTQNEDGAHVYEDSITEKTPKGKQIIHKDAMSLSKQRKTNNHPTWAEFEAQYVEEEDDTKSTSSSSTGTKTVVRKTAAEKAAEAEAKKREKEEAKAQSKAAKEEEKAQVKAAKEAEKAQSKAAKEEEKAQSKAAKEAAKKPTAAPKAPVKITTTKAPVSNGKALNPVTNNTVTKPKKVESEIPDDGMAHPWTFKAKKCLRTHANEVWEAKADGSMGKWLGIYDPTTEKIDSTAEEPTFDDAE